MIKKSHRWQRTAIAAAATALLALTASEVSALSLGRITVQSALGEALRAEVDIPEINAEEAASIKANAAPPSAFAAAGLEYNQSIAGLQARLARRSDGRAYLQLSTDRAINEPFIDIILEASWASGRIVRDYTLLFDPPPAKPAAPSPTLAQTSAPVSAPTPSVAPAPAPAPSPAVVNMPKLTIQAEVARTAPAPKAAPAAPVTTPAPAPVPAAPKLSIKPDSGSNPNANATAGERQITVKPGDTASKIASQGKAADVSLDQMLVALMRSNPDAFNNGNLNRLRSGAVLDMPTASQAKETSPQQATQMVLAQSKDFNEFRRNLASNAPKAALETPNRKASGSVEAKVEDHKGAVAVPDKLTLSKGALQAKSNEAQIAKERAERDAAARAAEIAKNIADLNKLNSAANAKLAKEAKEAKEAKVAKEAAAVAAQAASSKPTVPVAAPLEITAKTASAPVVAASAPAKAAETASSPASAPAPTMAAASAASAPAPAVVPASESGLLDQLMEDPVLPLAGGGAVLALVGGLLFYRRKQAQKAASHVDSSFLESRLQPDSFFGASGGQRVDTAQDNPGSSSSLAYSPSQLDSADDVDPVAEADVYLAYGRDLQAEEILKEALRHNPGRLAIHSKLLEIFAKRRDIASFQATANQAFILTGANHPDWVRICEQGLQIDPSNPLYQPGGATLSAFGSLEQAPAEGADANSTLAMPSDGVAAHGAGNVDLDLDLDFSDDDEAPSIVKPVANPLAQDDSSAAEFAYNSEIDANSIDFDISIPAALNVAAPEAPAQEHLSMDGLSLNPAEESAAPEFESPDIEMPSVPTALEDALQFDLGSLSLDLDSIATDAADSAQESTANSQETKLALAEEFVSIGDHDGARALIEEVIADSTGDLREKAQHALANLN